MMKNILFIPALCLFILSLTVQISYAKSNHKLYSHTLSLIDTIPPSELMDIIKTVVYATDKFEIKMVADLYTPNAVIADNEPPFSWNGPTAGIQWVNAVEKACKDARLTKLKANLDQVSFFQQNEDNAYMVIPVSYTGILPGKVPYSTKGAFTFVLRLINGRWLIKSQAWTVKR